MSGQLNSKEMQVWVGRRTEIVGRLLTFCKNHSIPVITRQSLDTVPRQSKKVVYLRIGDLIENFKSWQNFNNVCVAEQKIVYVVTDNFYKFQNLSNIYFFAFTELNGIFATDDPIIVERPKIKLFNCFMNRVESTRQSWFYFLHHYGLLDQGHVSFLLNCLPSYSKCQGKDLFDYIHKTYGLDQLVTFETAYQALKNSVPYQNFSEVGDLITYTVDSKYSLVLETCAPEDIPQWHVSEKSMRALQHPTIPLLFLQAHGLKLLKSLGFELGADYSYIDQMIWQDRQMALLKILIDDPFDYNETQAVDMCRHNRQVLRNMLISAEKKDYFDNLFTILLDH
jgi:hypothetical protein